ncbi:MAG: hypothetical protein LLF94_05305 [Chlamydiales bacterium]|nr:hypothetical protein [Chlamydiales bacterium]
MKNDALRLLHEKCLHAARKQQSTSGFIAEGEKIAIYDNFLFCLALFRSKMHENVLEAKKLLERLLYFQQTFDEVPSVGNYPMLLSDYPHCSDHLQALRVLVVQIWINKEFSLVLGAELNKRLQDSMQKLMQFLLSVHNDVKFPFWAKCKLAVCASYFDEAIAMPDLSDTSDLRTWGDPSAIAELIAAYQLRPTDAWKPMWQYLSRTWHEPSKQFVGPAYKLGYQHPNLQAAMALFAGSLEKLPSYPLYIALLTEDNALEKIDYPLEFSASNTHFSWSVALKEEYGVSTLLGSQTRELMPGFFPYYMVTGPHSLCIQSPFGYSTDELVFEIAPEVFLEDKERARALVISYNDHPQNSVLVSGLKATCFQIHEPLEITLGKKKLALTFTRISGDGEFVGHIVKGNRSGHCQERYTAIDAQIFLRALRGTTPTVIKVSLTHIN